MYRWLDRELKEDDDTLKTEVTTVADIAYLGVFLSYVPGGVLLGGGDMDQIPHHRPFLIVCQQGHQSFYKQHVLSSAAFCRFLFGRESTFIADKNNQIQRDRYEDVNSQVSARFMIYSIVSAVRNSVPASRFSRSNSDSSGSKRLAGTLAI
jgi:hypothetical protein